MTPAALAENPAPMEDTAADTLVPSTPAGDLEPVLDVPLSVAFELARCTITAGDLLALGPGSVIPLGSMDVDSVKVLVEGEVVGSGEVTVCEEHYGIRVTGLGDDRGDGV